MGDLKTLQGVGGARPLAQAPADAGATPLAFAARELIHDHLRPLWRARNNEGVLPASPTDKLLVNIVGTEAATIAGQNAVRVNYDGAMVRPESLEPVLRRFLGPAFAAVPLAFVDVG